METVLYFQSPSKNSASDKVRGVRRYAAIANWHIQVLDEFPSAKSVLELYEFWNPVGSIIECGGGDQDIDTGIFTKIPAVYLDRNPLTLPPDVSCISHDSVATGRLAAKELLVTGHPNFAYVPYPKPRFWSDDRERGFKEALKLNGKTCNVFNGQGSLQSISWHKSLRKWVDTIAKPCAIFAANDNVAAEILTAAAQSGFDVPRDIAVCGVDNFVPVCEHTAPTLTSIQPDFLLAGELAARTLDDIIRRGDSNSTPVRLTFGPTDIIRRASTRTSARYDPEVTAAMELIRRHACEGISSADALTIFKCSRRMAEIRFRQTTGHSILDEIQTIPGVYPFFYSSFPLVFSACPESVGTTDPTILPARKVVLALMYAPLDNHRIAFGCIHFALHLFSQRCVRRWGRYRPRLHVARRRHFGASPLRQRSLFRRKIAHPSAYAGAWPGSEYLHSEPCTRLCGVCTIPPLSESPALRLMHLVRPRYSS